MKICLSTRGDLHVAKLFGKYGGCIEEKDGATNYEALTRLLTYINRKQAWWHEAEGLVNEELGKYQEGRENR